VKERGGESKVLVVTMCSVTENEPKGGVWKVQYGDCICAYYMLAGLHTQLEMTIQAYARYFLSHALRICYVRFRLIAYPSCVSLSVLEVSLEVLKLNGVVFERIDGNYDRTYFDWPSCIPSQ